MVVTFCGHREVVNAPLLDAWLNEIAEALIQEGANCFYLGGYGQFDRAAAAAIRKQKERYPQIRSVLVLPYLDATLPTADYDETVYPPLESVPKRYAILRRNQYMVDKADVVVAYVSRSFGGAYQTLQYAKRKRKRIVSYPLT